MIRVNDFFEIGNEKYLVLCKNEKEITVVVQTNRDIKILIKHENFFYNENIKIGTENPFCNIDNLVSLLENLNHNYDVQFLGYTKYQHGKNMFEKRKAHNVFQIFLNIQNEYFSLMISETPAFQLLTDYYYTEGWNYDLKNREIVFFSSIEAISDKTVSCSKDFVVVKESLDMQKQGDSISLNGLLKIHTDLSEIQIEELKENRNVYHLNNKEEFINRFSKD